MSEIQYVTGDATHPQGSGVQVIAHCCNNIGGWGSGFVLALNERWSRPRALYRKWHKDKRSKPINPLTTPPRGYSVPFQLGHAILVEVETDLWVANIIGQHKTISAGEKTPIRYKALTEGLTAVGVACRNMGASVHMPRLGAGLAQGNWDTISQIIQETLVDRETSVTVYDLP